MRCRSGHDLQAVTVCNDVGQSWDKLDPAKQAYATHATQLATQLVMLSSWVPRPATRTWYV